MNTNLNENSFLIIGMVGLPARGKSYISKKLQRYLGWMNYKSKVFNIGNYRRKIIGTNMDFSEFFDPNNEENNKKREECAVEALKDIGNHINMKLINVAILDGTNTTIKRRELVENQLNSIIKVRFSVIWIESICTIDSIINKNIVNCKLKSDDYMNWSDKDQIIQDFKKRIALYEKVYQPISHINEDIKYIKIINQGKNIEMNNIYGYLESKIISYLINLHTDYRAIYFTRHGESIYNLKHLCGGNSSLSEKGIKFSKALSLFFNKEFKSNQSFLQPKLFYSSLKRTIETAEGIIKEGAVFKSYSSQKSLDEISTGLRDGLSYDQIKTLYPREYQERSSDKLNYRYPQGESYIDVIKRIEPMIYEIERSRESLVIIGHQAMLRCLYGYFINTPLEKIPTLEIPLHVVIKYIPKENGYVEERFYIDVDTEEVTKTVSEYIEK